MTSCRSIAIYQSFLRAVLKSSPDINPLSAVVAGGGGTHLLCALWESISLSTPLASFIDLVFVGSFFRTPSIDRQT